MAYKVVLITGAAGFLGSHFCRVFTERGYEVRALVRNPEAAGSLREHSRGGIFRCILPESIDPAAFSGPVQALIHCAYETRTTNRAQAYRTNVEGTRMLLKLAREQGVEQFAFISSLSAVEGAESFYGQSKLQMEGLLDPNQDLILRPGMVIGAGGVFNRLRLSLSRSRIVPLFYGGRQQIQTLSVEDLCNTIETAVRRPLTGLFRVAEPEPLSIREFYGGISALEGKKPLFIPLPGAPALFALRLFERLGLRLPVTSENLLGLKQLRAFDVRPDLERLGVTVRPFGESLGSLKATPT